MAFVAEEGHSAVDTVAHWAVAEEEQHVAVVAEQTVGVAHSAVEHFAAAALEVVDQQLDTAAHWVAVETVVEGHSAVAAVDLPEYSAVGDHWAPLSFHPSCVAPAPSIFLSAFQEF